MRQARFAICSIVFFVLSAQLCFAWPYYGGNDRMAYVLTGVIEKTGINTIDIRDEDDKVLKRFVYFGSDIQVGDRVRILYNPKSGLVEQLKKMTPVEYEPQTGENKGYILKQVPKKESAQIKDR